MTLFLIWARSCFHSRPHDSSLQRKHNVLFCRDSELAWIRSLKQLNMNQTSLIFLLTSPVCCVNMSRVKTKNQNSNNIWAFRSKITSSGHNINIKMFILFKIIKILIEVLTNMWQIQCKVSLALQQLLNGISGALVAETSEKFLLKFLRSWNF